MDKYESKLNKIETEVMIKYIKDNFENELGKKLDLIRISAPLFTYADSGINDDLNGVERPVKFDIKNIDKKAVIIHSLAKWKRLALARYNFPLHKGIYTDMNAIRRDEDVDNIHSIYVDQWDWEKVISNDDRNINYLKHEVNKIYSVIKKINNKVINKFPNLTNYFSSKVTFITSEKLLKLYPSLEPFERANEFAKLHGTIFIIGIGHKLSDGKEQDLRAPDYDDWNLNGDLLTYYPPLNLAIELSSMGIRVNKESLLKQLELTNSLDRAKLYFHQKLLNDELPLSLGGGIGQSRMCLIMLNKIHIGEVQSSIWDKKTLDYAKENNINLL